MGWMDDNASYYHLQHNPFHIEERRLRSAIKKSIY